MSTTDDTPQSGDRKRRRVALACSACRTRKSRCDGVRPRCSSCVRLNYECIYMQLEASSNAIVGKEYLKDLEDRLEQVEEMLGTLIESRPYPVQDQNVDAQTARSRQVPSIRRQPSSTPRDDPSDAGQEIVFAAEGGDGFFGPSSNIALTRQVAKAASHLSRNIVPNTGYDDHDGHATVPHTTAISYPAEAPDEPTEAIDMYELPPTSKMKELVKRYFQFANPIYPYVHEETFLAHFADVEARRFRNVRRSWLGKLNIVMALGSHIPVSKMDAVERAQDCDLYYRRALKLCDTDLVRGTSLELVQYLLLLGQYLQGTQNSVKSWNIHGLAVKGALQLGLHSSEASSSFTLLEREIRKRTWYGCIILDRNLSMTFGRPAAIPNNYIRLDPVQPFHSRGITTRNRDTESYTVEFYNATIDLCKIVYNTIDTLYGNNLGCGINLATSELVSTTLQLDQQLVTWECMLSSSMGLVKSSEISLPPGSLEETFSLHRFKTVLTTRRLNIQLLIHRPMITRLLLYERPSELSEQARKDFELLWHAGPASIRKAIHSASEIIGIGTALISASPQDWQTMLGAWWYTLYYSFNAGLMIVAVLLVREKFFLRSGEAEFAASMDVPTAMKALDDSITTLRRLEHVTEIAKRCADYLNKLQQTINTMETANTHQWTQADIVSASSTVNWTSPSGDVPYVHPPAEFLMGAHTEAEAEYDWDSFMAETGQELFPGF